jgi:Ni/Co efflux regulator RcnB
MIDKPGHPTGQLRDRHRQETTMLKMFSAAVIAASIIAAPAMAAGSDRAATTHKVATTERHVQPGALNANAKMMHRHHDYRHHHRHVRPHAHFHKKLGMSHMYKHTAIKTTVVHKRG